MRVISSTVNKELCRDDGKVVMYLHSGCVGGCQLWCHSASYIWDKKGRQV